MHDAFLRLLVNLLRAQGKPKPLTVEIPPFGRQRHCSSDGTPAKRRIESMAQPSLYSRGLVKFSKLSHEVNFHRLAFG